MIDEDLCLNCDCFNCVYDYGFAVCSAFGSCLCKTTRYSPCNNCKNNFQEIVTDCPERIIEE